MPIASSLRLSSTLVPKLIAEADAARAARLIAKLGPLPTDWALGEPLRVGDKVVFAGFDGRERERARLERRTQELGVRVLGAVSGLTAMLVSDGSFAEASSREHKSSVPALLTPKRTPSCSNISSPPRPPCLSRDRRRRP